MYFVNKDQHKRPLSACISYIEEALSLCTLEDATGHPLMCLCSFLFFLHILKEHNLENNERNKTHDATCLGKAIDNRLAEAHASRMQAKPTCLDIILNTDCEERTE